MSKQDKIAAAEAGTVTRCGALLADSPTFKHVLEFAFRMEAKLANNRHKGDREGWLKDDPWSLVERILDETVEVQQCFTVGSDGRTEHKDAEDLANECADVANFCMMLADRVTNERPSKCPQCGDPIIQTNLGGGKTDDYCENCGWPDENRPEN